MSGPVHNRTVRVVDISMENPCSVFTQVVVLKGKGFLLVWEYWGLVHVIPETVDLVSAFETIVGIKWLPVVLGVFIEIVNVGWIPGPAVAEVSIFEAIVQENWLDIRWSALFFEFHAIFVDKEIVSCFDMGVCDAH